MCPIAHVDSWEDGAVRFITYFDATGCSGAPVSTEAMRRLVSLAIVQRLSDSSLKDAYDHLIDCYMWQDSSRQEVMNSGQYKAVQSAKKGFKQFRAAPIQLEDN